MPKLLELEIDSLAHDGRGIGRLPEEGGRRLVVFVSGALPGMRALCELAPPRAGHAEATALRILRPLPQQLDPGCPHASRCGGCPLLPMPQDEQRRWKEKLALDALKRIGKIPEKQLQEAWRGLSSLPPEGLPRNRITLAFGNGPEGLLLGLRRAASHEVIACPGCQLLGPAAMRIAESCARLAQAERLPAHAPGKGGFWRFLGLRRGYVPGTKKEGFFALLITSRGSHAQRQAAARLGQRLMEKEPQLLGFAHEEREAEDALARGEKRVAALGSTKLELDLGGRRFGLDLASFFQVNSQGAQALSDLAAQLMPDLSGARLLDLYCGVGAPGLLLGAGAITGLEQDPRAIAMARINARSAGMPGSSYHAMDAARLTERMAAGAEAALLDPPRQGIPPRLAATLCRMKLPRLLYISCNPATLARDLERLAPRYSLASLGAVDMFPNTPHVECAALLKEKNAS